MKKKEKMSPHIIAVAAFVVFIVLGLACASTKAVKSAASIDEVTGLANKLTWLKANAKSGGNYILEVNANESMIGSDIFAGNLSYKNESNITITIKGVGENRTISLISAGYLFRVGSGVTLILDENITLKGFKVTNLMDVSSTRSVVSVDGTLVMNDGATITGGMNNFDNGGGVYVFSGGTFLMKGGTIAGNTCFPTADAAAVASSKGEYTNMYDPGTYKGAGVYVVESTADSKNLWDKLSKNKSGGTFTKTGGTIYGYTGDSNGNVVRDFGGQNVLQNHGHAVYAGSERDNKRKEATAGPEVNLHYSDGEFSGDWDF